jgi:hypothetical protein
VYQQRCLQDKSEYVEGYEPSLQSGLTHTGSTYTSEPERNFGGTDTNSKAVLTVTGDTGLHLQFTSSNGVGMVLDMKYLGACPAGMAVGDFVLSNGMKMNVLTGASSGDSAR